MIQQILWVKGVQMCSLMFFFFLSDVTLQMVRASLHTHPADDLLLRQDHLRGQSPGECVGLLGRIGMLCDLLKMRQIGGEDETAWMEVCLTERRRKRACSAGSKSGSASINN